MPVWVIGHSLRGYLLLLTPRRLSSLFNRHRYQDVFNMVPHEFAHLLINRIVGYPGVQEIPVWLHEGLATYLAGQQNRGDQAVRDGARRGTLPTLQQLDESWAQQAQIGYAMSYSIVNYLSEKYGPERMLSLLKALADGTKFDAALQQVMGIDSPALEQEWREWLLGG